jgi:hypothetical protein
MNYIVYECDEILYMDVIKYILYECDEVHSV